MKKITFFGNTDMGQIRTNNEDAFIAQTIWDENHILAVAIDGVGGYEGGEVASAMAQKHIVEYLETYSNGERQELLKQAVIFANNAIYTERKNNSEYSHMSCVLTAVLVEVENMQIHMAHVGDTRLYQLANGAYAKLSHDHSLIGYREEIGELTEEEAMRHPQRNVIGRDVGSKFLETSEASHVEVDTFPLIPNSTLLLCSDGLCDMITSDHMRCELEREIPLQEKVQNLIKAANNAGGKDNVTVVLVEYTDPDFVASQPQSVPVEVEEHIQVPAVEVEKSKGGKRRGRGLRVFLLICLMIIVGMAGSFVGTYVGEKVARVRLVDSIDVLNNEIDLLREEVEAKGLLIDSLQAIKNPKSLKK